MFTVSAYPSDEILTTARAKAHVGIDASDTSRDTLIAEYIQTANATLYDETHIMCGPSTIIGRYDNWVDIVAYFEPVNTVTISYKDVNGDPQSMVEDTDFLVFSGYPTRIKFLETPDLEDEASDRITITFDTGYADTAACPTNVLQALRFIVGDYVDVRATNHIGGAVGELKRATTHLLKSITRRIGL